MNFLTLAILFLAVTMNFEAQACFPGSFSAYSSISTNVESEKCNGQKLEPFLELPMRYETIPFNLNELEATRAAKKTNGLPVVLWNMKMREELSAAVMGFLIQHEYAKYELEYKDQNMNPALITANADCRAAKYLVQNGKSSALEAVIQWFQIRGCSYDPRSPLYSINEEICGTQRAVIIKQCSSAPSN